jgi:hypothetical protein
MLWVMLGIALMLVATASFGPAGGLQQRRLRPRTHKRRRRAA